MSATEDVTLRLRRRPPPDTLRWVARAVGAGAAIVGVRRMRGAWSAAVHAVDVRDAAGDRHRLVLRRFVRADWLARKPDLAEREARVLALLGGAEVSAPLLVAVDACASETDVPAVLMTRLAGRVDLAPRHLDARLDGLAAALPSIHAVAIGRTRVQPYAPYYDLAAQHPPAWTRHRAAWEALIARASRPAPPAPRVFIHRDYHPGNVLWSRGRISGVLDWVNASVGPPGVDVAHCRSNIVVLHGVDAAERFRVAYEALPGAAPHDAYWDACSMLDGDLELTSQDDPSEPDAWTDQGRSDLTGAWRRRRLDEYAVWLAARL